MGAPPGVPDAASAPIPIDISTPTDPSVAAPPPTRSQSFTVRTGGAAPSSAYQGPTGTGTSTLTQDEERLRLTRGLRLFGEHLLDPAKMELQPLDHNVLAQDVLEKIRSNEALFHSQQVAAVLKALGLDAAQISSYSNADRDLLLQAVDTVEAKFLATDGKDLAIAIEAARKEFSGDTLKIWNRFSQEQQTSLQELEAAFKEADPLLLADNLIALAERFRERKLYGTAWTLAKLASEYTPTQARAREILNHLEGTRSSTQYIISDMFDHGGTSLAIDLLSLIPAVSLTGRLSRMAWLANRGPWLRIPMTMLTAGSIHWGATKLLKTATGYSGQILPRSVGEFGGEFLSSTLQASLALFLSNKWLWKSKLGSKQAAEAIEAAAGEKVAAPTLRLGQKLALGGRKLGKGLWWTTKTTMKVGVVTVTDLALAQLPLHLTKIHNMTPQGFPDYLLPILPGIRDARRTVAETAMARKTFLAYQAKVESNKTFTTSLPSIDPTLDLDLLITKLDPELDGKKRELTYAILAQASAQGTLGLNIRRWILQKKKLGELVNANNTLERQGIPLRFETDGSLCITDSPDFACQAPPKDK